MKVDDQDVVRAALCAQEYIKELEDHNQELFEVLSAAVSCLDNIDYLIKKQSSGCFGSHVLLDGIERELKTGAYETAQTLVDKEKP